MFNVAILTGRLTADPELKTTPNGTSVTSFSIAVEREYKSGEERKTDFINIVAWRQTAEFITHYFTKGTMIGIKGAIQTRKYQDRDGNNRTAFEVVAEHADFVVSKPNNQGDNQVQQEQTQEPSSPTSQSEGFEQGEYDDDLPY